jgi:hypothetical protein
MSERTAAAVIGPAALWSRVQELHRALMVEGHKASPLTIEEVIRTTDEFEREDLLVE